MSVNIMTAKVQEPSVEISFDQYGNPTTLAALVSLSVPNYPVPAGTKKGVLDPIGTPRRFVAPTSTIIMPVWDELLKPYSPRPAVKRTSRFASLFAELYPTATASRPTLTVETIFDDDHSTTSDGGASLPVSAVTNSPTPASSVVSLPGLTSEDKDEDEEHKDEEEEDSNE
ncbi:MAG: hypothetical protein M1833_003919 [Piccolia ochrophora]|nr:MAG: hypothetical protein M1833_003919 [Piccolia ochrophora]